MSFLSHSYSRISCKPGLVNYAAFDFRKHRTLPIPRVCLAERKPDDSTSGFSSGEKPRIALRPQKPTVGQAARQGERNHPSAGQSAFAPKPYIYQPHRQDEQRGSSAHQSASSPKQFASQAHRQTLSVHALRRPAHITAYTKQEKLAAISLAKGGHPEAALTGFYGSMEALFGVAGSQMDHINYAAIVTASAHVWEAAQLNDRFGSHAGVHEGLEVLYQRCVQSLQPLLADMHAQGFSTVLWSSAKLGLNPDASVPGMVHELTLRFVHLTDAASEQRYPNAQECANMLWALATMAHPAATVEVVDSVGWHFTRLSQHPDTQQRPNAQSATNVLWALATMGHPASAEVLDSITTSFARLIDSTVAGQRPHARAVAIVVWALGTLKHAPSDDRLLDHFCAYMHTLLRSQDQRTRPDAQNIANTLWGLKELKHAPSADVVSSMLAHFVVLCQVPGLQPDPQSISNCLVACAELGLSVNATCLQSFLEHLLKMHMSRASFQVYCNVAWSLAVMGSLTISMFDALLCQISTKIASMQSPLPDTRQLYQALAWLKPAPGSKQMEAWCSLRSRLQTAAQEPGVVPTAFPGQAKVYAALALQALPYKSQVPLGTYWAHAVLSSSNTEVPKVLLAFQRPQDFIANIPSRVLGHVAFRNEMLGRYGTVVTVPYNPDKSNAESLASAIKAAVEAQTGLPLDSFRR